MQMTVTKAPFDLAEVKLAAPSVRPGTVAKADVISRLCAATAPCRDRGRARRLRQDDPSRAGGPRPIRVRSPGSRSTAETTTRWCFCGRSRPRFTGSSPSRPTSSMRCPGQVDRPGRHGSRVSAARWPHVERPLVLALDDLHAVGNPVCLDVLAELYRYVPAGSQIAIASREEPGTAPRPLAGAGLGERDRRRVTSGWTSRKPGCCLQPRVSSSTPARSPS